MASSAPSASSASSAAALVPCVLMMFSERAYVVPESSLEGVPRARAPFDQFDEYMAMLRVCVRLAEEKRAFFCELPYLKLPAGHAITSIDDFVVDSEDVSKPDRSCPTP